MLIKNNEEKNPNIIRENNHDNQNSSLAYYETLLNEQIQNLNKIQIDLKKILKENYKVRDAYLNYNSNRDECELSKQNSEAVSIDKEELIDRLSPIIEGMDPKNGLNLANLNENFSAINYLIKKLGDVSKVPDNSINLDISNTSLINSIYLSNMMTNDKNKQYDQKENFLDNEPRTTFVEIEKFIMQHEDKLYFYDVLFDYMSNFIKSKKVRFNLVREKPQILGTLIESILRDWLKSKKSLDYYKTRINKLIINK